MLYPRNLFDHKILYCIININCKPTYARCAPCTLQCTSHVRLATSHYITPSHKNMQPHTTPYMLPHTTSIPLPHNLRAGRMPGKFTATYTQWGARVEILHIHTHAHAPKSGAGDGSGASQSEAWGRYA